MDVTIKAGSFELRVAREGFNSEPFFKGKPVDNVKSFRVSVSAGETTDAAIHLEIINDEEMPKELIRDLREAGVFVVVDRLGPIVETQMLPPKDIVKKHGTTVVTDY